jgi:integrase
MEDYIDYLRSKKHTGQTIQGYITVTKLLFRFHGAPLSFSYRIPRADKQQFDLKHEKRWFSDREVAMCRTYQFHSNHTRNHILIRLLTETGARENEIAHITVGDVNIWGKEVLITHSKTIPRTVFISQETAILLENYFQSKYPDQRRDIDVKIFPGKNQIYKIICKMLLDLDLKIKKDGRGPHTFRHFVATFLYFEKNMPLTDVAFIMGDKTPTIENNYLHPTTAMLGSRMRKASGW